MKHGIIEGRSRGRLRSTLGMAAAGGAEEVCGQESAYVAEGQWLADPYDLQLIPRTWGHVTHAPGSSGGMRSAMASRC